MATEIYSSVKESGEAADGKADESAIFECSIGIMAHNEEANVERTLRAVFAQRGPVLRIREVIVIASGCTDRTVPIVAELARSEPRLRLCVQERREGKAAAINLFLRQARSQFLILLGADVIPAENACELLCEPFHDEAIGMTGGRPVPTNNPATFMGYTAHLLWRLHDRVARQAPKLGEIIAFRNVIADIPITSAVDEISIQALITHYGYQLLYQPGSVVYNKGPLSVRDFLKQRRRIYAGHLKILHRQHYAASTMKSLPILRQLLAERSFALSSPRRWWWTLGAMLLEAGARLLGHLDYWRGNEQYIWPMITSTKKLELEEQSGEPGCLSSS